MHKMHGEYYKNLFLIVIFWCSRLEVRGQSTRSEWTNKEADIYVLMDCSSSIWIVDFEKMLGFFAELVEDMDIRQAATRIGFGVFSDNHRMVIPINNNYNKTELKRQILKLPYLKGDTYISRALRGLREQGLSPSVTRKDVPHIGLLLTDGMSRHKQLTSDNATLVKQMGIFMFTIGVGHAVEPDELRMIASDPKPDHYYYVADFDHLKDIRTQLSTKMSQVEIYQGDVQKCGDNIFDTVFVFDEARVGEIGTAEIKNFIQYFVKNFTMNSGNIRVGVVSKTCHEGDIFLGQHVTEDNFIAELQSNKGLEISDLLKRARMTSFSPENGARYGAKQRIVLILHGNGAKQPETTREAVRAKYVGIEIIVIYLGTDYNKNFINGLASYVDFAIFWSDISQLKASKSKDEFRRIFCAEH